MSEKREEILHQLERILSQIVAKKVTVSEQTSVYGDLSIAGDDAIELIEWIHSKFGTKFDGFRFDEYFRNETDAFAEHLARLVGFKRNIRRPLFVSHLVDVIDSGAWFDPPNYP